MTVAVLTPDQVQALASDAYRDGYLRAQLELETALLTTADVAKRLGYASTAPVLDRIRRGDLTALKIGDEWRLRPSAVRAFIDKCEELTAGSGGSPQ